MLRMCSLLEHACTLFTVNASTKQCFLKIFLDARGLDKSSLSATLNEESEIVLNATSETISGDELLRRHVEHVLTVPNNVNLLETQVILLQSGFLLLNIPYKVTQEIIRNPDSQTAEKRQEIMDHLPECPKSPMDIESKSSDDIPMKMKVTELDKHETIRRGNQLILIVPLNRKYKEEDIKVQVVERSVCITAVSREPSRVHTDGRTPHIVQRTFYKEYEASDCTPDPKSIVFHLEDNCLHVELTVAKGCS